MNTVWNNTVWNGMLFDRTWILASAGAAAVAVIVAVMALVVGRAVRSRPAPMRYGLLLAALVVLGIVPAVAVASRLTGWVVVTVPAAAVDRPLAAGSVVATTTAWMPLRQAASAADTDFLPSEHVEETAGAPLGMPTFLEMASCLLWVWFGGIVFFVGIVTRDLVRLRRLGGSLVPCTSPEAIGLLDEAARAVGLTQPPRLCESAAVPVPVVIGPVTPVIVLPKGMAHSLDREKLSAVLVHEAAHVVHGDLWVGSCSMPWLQCSGGARLCTGSTVGWRRSARRSATTTWWWPRATASGWRRCSWRWRPACAGSGSGWRSGPWARSTKSRRSKAAWSGSSTSRGRPRP